MVEVPSMLILLTPCLWAAVAALAYALSFRTLPKKDRILLLNRLVWAVIALSALTMGGGIVGSTIESHVLTGLPDPGG